MVISRLAAIGLLLVLDLGLAGMPAAAGEGDAASSYAAHCASCHGADRLGGIGPALLPESLERLRRGAAAQVIAEGRPATQMPGFADHLSEKQIARLVKLLYTPVADPPVWGEAEITRSHAVYADPAGLPAAPQYKVDPLNLFVVVESGDHHVTILDGDRFEPIARFKSRFALHGGPKFSPDGRFVYFASRDGWISKYDLHSLQMIAEIRAGLNARNLAISDDGGTIAVADYLPQALVLLDARDLALRRLIVVEGGRDERSSRVSAVYQAPPRKSFIAALKDVPEIWEIFYGEHPRKVASGLGHSSGAGMVESSARNGRFPIRRIALDEPLDDFFFDPDYRNLIGSSRTGGKVVVVNLDVGRTIATLAIPGLPHLGSGISWMYRGRPVVATPDLKESAVSVIDMKSWSLLKRIDTIGPGFFLRGHEGSPFVWADALLSPHKDTLQIIDTRTLEVVRSLTPEPGRTAAHVEFTRDGRYALVSIWEMDGALLIYDARSFQLVKRIPMVKPSGKYNVWNKIHFSSGTSH